MSHVHPANAHTSPSCDEEIFTVLDIDILSTKSTISPNIPAIVLHVACIEMCVRVHVDCVTVFGIAR